MLLMEINQVRKYLLSRRYDARSYGVNDVTLYLLLATLFVLKHFKLSKKVILRKKYYDALSLLLKLL
jgi:hypothetical protein